MKKFTLIILMIIISCSVKGQVESYVPFPTENAQWSVCDDKYSLYGDTIIDGIKYSKVYKQTSDSAFEFDINKAEYFCAIRNDEENKRVYGIYRDLLPVINAIGVEIDHPTKEMLLYDFSLKIGDTVSVVNFDEVDVAGYISYVDFVRVEVLGVYIYDGNGSYDLLNLHDNDSIVTLENGEQRRRMLLISIGGTVSQYWIEGIGSNEGPFVHDIYGFLEYSPKRLLCYKENDDYLYYQDEFDVDGDVDCFSSKYYAVDIKENDINNHISIYPNPANGIVNVENIPGKECYIDIYNNKGQRIISKTIVSSSAIDISHLSCGLYIINVNSNNENKSYRLIKN